MGVTIAEYALRMAAETRYFVVCVPHHLDSDARVSCVFYAHGVGGTAWYGAKEDTQWLHLAAASHLIVVFVQSKGLFFEEKRKNSVGKEVWAASSWDFVHSSGDLAYLDAAYDSVVRQLFPGVIDPGRVFFCGYDSGGMMAWSVACSMGGSKFAAVFAYNGGIDEHYICDRRSMVHPVGARRGTSVDQTRCPVWLSCGELYEHKGRTEAAERMLDELGWQVKMTELKGKGAEWPRGMEMEIFDWFQTARDDALSLHVQDQ